MKKQLLCSSLALLLAAGCSSGTAGSASTKKSNDLYYVFTSDVKSTDYMITQNASDHQVNQNLVSGLTEVNSDNEYVGDIAKSWTHNDDYTVWTFKLRDDAKWVTNNGEEYADVVADDFVAGLQHAADFQSATLYLATPLIKGLSAYCDGTDTNFDDVGIKAVDDHTLEYTLDKTATYFDSIVSYTIFYPVNREFLESQGDGCKLGSPDTNNCSFGQPTEPSSILYNGAYILQSFVSKSEEKMTKNDAYWDADHVYIENVNLEYDDGSDPDFTIKGFERSENPYYMALLYTTADDFKEKLETYKENAYSGQQNQYTFGVNFNLNRVTYNTTDKTTDQQADTREALLNTDFRLALKYGFDRVSYLTAIMDKSVASLAIRNTECPWSFVKTSDGTSYGELVQNDSTLGASDMSEGQDPYYNADTAKEYLEKAKATMTDVSWPIKLDLMVEDSDSALVAQASSLEQSIEASLGSDNVDIVVHPVSTDEYEQSSYTSTGPTDADWDISTSTGWGYDYVDPMSYLHIFSPVDGDVTRTSMGLEFEADGDAQNNAAIKAAGLDEYQSLLDTADAITDDMDARYEAFAKAEAYLLDNALFIPVQTQASSVNYRVSRAEPFTQGYESVKYKGMIIDDDPITASSYKKALKKWEAQ